MDIFGPHPGQTPHDARRIPATVAADERAVGAVGQGGMEEFVRVSVHGVGAEVMVRAAGGIMVGLFGPSRWSTVLPSVLRVARETMAQELACLPAASGADHLLEVARRLDLAIRVTHPSAETGCDGALLLASIRDGGIVVAGTMGARALLLVDGAMQEVFALGEESDADPTVGGGLCQGLPDIVLDSVALPPLAAGAGLLLTTQPVDACFSDGLVGEMVATEAAEWVPEKVTALAAVHGLEGVGAAWVVGPEDGLEDVSADSGHDQFGGLFADLAEIIPDLVADEQSELQLDAIEEPAFEEPSDDLDTDVAADSSPTLGVALGRLQSNLDPWLDVVHLAGGVPKVAFLGAHGILNVDSSVGTIPFDVSEQPTTLASLHLVSPSFADGTEVLSALLDGRPRTPLVPDSGDPTPAPAVPVTVPETTWPRWFWLSMGVSGAALVLAIVSWWLRQPN